METPGRTNHHTALAESQNILQDQPVGADPSQHPSCTKSSGMDSMISSGVSCASATPAAATAAVAAVEATTPVTGVEEGQSTARAGAGTRAAAPTASVAAAEESGRESPERASDPGAGEVAGEDAEAASLALARQLLEEEAMASYAAAVDMFRNGRGAGEGQGVAALEGIASEDMAAMQALLQEDENASNAVAMAEDESLDYDGMLELGNAIGDVRQERWRLRCETVISSLPRMKYAAGGIAGDDVKCLVCQCDFEEGEELRELPCKHAFHAACVDGWLAQNEECPTCRRSISES
ncbi:unnamed protein product [Ascophyllum nodosum]